MPATDTVDPAVIEASRRAARHEPAVDFRTLADAPVREIRAAYDRTCAYWNARPPALPSVVDTTVEGPHGTLRLRIYRPSEARGPGVLYLHGGGFMLGSVETHDTLCRLLALEAGAVLISVNYRLAPEYRFPVAYEECRFACGWLIDRGTEFGVDPDRLAIGGDSAGANLALSVLHAERETLRAGVLFYGCYGHLPEFGYPLGAAAAAYGDGRYGLGLDLMRRFYADYLRNEADGRDPRFCSLRSDVRGLPPVLLAAAALDPLRDDTEAFRRRLERARVPHRYVLYPGMPHGFLKLAPEVDTARQGLRDAALFLREHCRP